MIQNWINEIKWAYQRVVRGYDDRVKWEFSNYFLNVIPALEEFCVEQLFEREDESMTNNPEREKIYLKTLNLIQDWKAMTGADDWKDPNQETKLLEYVGRNIGYYWD